MHKFIFFCLVLIPLAGYVYAENISDGYIGQATNGPAVQVFFPNKAKTRNDTVTGTKPYRCISTAQTLIIRGRCTDGSGNAVPCKRRANNQTAYAPLPNGEDLVGVTRDISSYCYHGYSGASRTMNINTERQTR